MTHGFQPVNPGTCGQPTKQEARSPVQMLPYRGALEEKHNAMRHYERPRSRVGNNLPPQPCLMGLGSHRGPKRKIYTWPMALQHWEATELANPLPSPWGRDPATSCSSRVSPSQVPSMEPSATAAGTPRTQQPKASAHREEKPRSREHTGLTPQPP